MVSYEEQAINASLAGGKLFSALMVAVAAHIPESRGSRMSFEDFLLEVHSARPYFHAHQCENNACKHIWMHPHSHAGNELSHMCPKCHNGPFWDRYEERGHRFKEMQDLELLFEF